MASITEAIIEGSGGQKGLHNGRVVWKSLTKSAIVSGLTGDEENKTDDAISLCPTIGTFLTIDYEELQLASINVEFVSTDVANCKMSYSFVDLSNTPIISIGTSSQTVTTNVDKDGELMIVEYTDTRDKHLRDNKGANPQKQVFQTTKKAPCTVLVYTRIEDESPLQKSTDYTCHTNSVTWMGYPPRTWICDSIQGNNMPDGRYRVVHTMLYREETWDKDAYYKFASGVIPDDVVITKKQVQGSINFAGLNLI